MRELTEQQTRVVAALTEVARPLILTGFSADSCIASTRVGIDVLAYFGITARELPVLAVVFNGEAAALLEAGASMEELQQILAPMSPKEPGGPWSIGVGAGDGTGWSGHLVIQIPQPQIVVDLSIDQASRPLKNMDLHPYWAVVTDTAWWAEEVPATPVARFPDGSVVLLDRRAPDPVGYRQSPNWKPVGPRLSEHRALVGAIIRKIRDGIS